MTVAAAFQMASIPARPRANLDTAIEGIRSAAAAGARLVVLPECALNGYDPEWFAVGAPGAQAYPSAAFNQFAQLSHELSVTIAVCDLERADNTLYDTSFVFDGGKLGTRHRKLVPTERELAAGITAGRECAVPVRSAAAGLLVAPMICYEYAFPQIAFQLARAGAELIALSSAIRSGYGHLPPVRIRARAQDNGCYVVAANATGPGFCGQSLIADPRGNILAQATAASTEVLVAEVNTAVVKQEREFTLPSAQEHERVEALIGLQQL